MISNTALFTTVILNISNTRDISYLNSLKEVAKNTKYANFIKILEVIEEYYINYKQLPERKYIEKHFLELDIANIEEFLPEYPLELLGRLKQEIISEELKKAQEAPQNFQTFKKLRDVIVYNSPKQETFNTFDDTDLSGSLEKEYDKVLNRATGVLLNTNLDTKTRGCPFGATTAIGAIAGCGKSNVALATAYSAVATQNLKGIYISLELSKKVIYQRLVSRFLYEQGMEIDNNDIIHSTLSDRNRQQYFKAIPEFQKLTSNNLRIVTQEDLPDFNRAGLETFFSSQDDTFNGIDFVILDQVSLLKYFEPINGRGTAKDEYAIINQYIRYLTTLSYEGFFRKPVAMILLCQIKREAFPKINKRKPLDLSVFAEANELERSANQAIVLRYTDELRMSGLIEHTLIKNRDGEASLEYHPAIFLPQYSVLGAPSIDDSPQGIQEIVSAAPAKDLNVEDLL